jgi:hypothetical protein
MSKYFKNAFQQATVNYTNTRSENMFEELRIAC